MLFNSGVFLKFFAGFLLLYWLVRGNLRARNILILVASYVFYGWWDWRFLGLLVFSCVVDFAVALQLERTSNLRRRKMWLAVSIVSNLAILGFFKYYGFFARSFGELLQSLDIPYRAYTLDIVLPVGISFYTFQAMSYTIDVYRRHIPASRNLLNFLAYVAFFPQLVAGPIERASHLLPQFERTLRITRPMLEEGVWLMLWGMFKKVVIADNLDPLVRMVYTEGQVPSGGVAVLLGTIAFGVQIYCDFSGYSDIARGTARVLGFDIMWNFNIPYAATNITEFWRRWHISLSTWLRDYLYISLGGNRRGRARTYANLLVTMLLGGLWHGAAWNYVFWGAWHGIGLVAHRAMAGGRKRDQASNGAGELPRLQDRTGRVESAGPPRWNWSKAPAWVITMCFVFYGWLLFRAKSIEQIIGMTQALADFSLPVWATSYAVNLAAFTLPLVLMQIWQLRTGSVLAPLALRPWPRAVLQGTLLLALILFWERREAPFIYFQF